MDNIGIFGCSHIPYEHKNYLGFVIDTCKKYRVKRDNMYCAGDLVDNHAVSYHEKEPGLYSPGNELKLAKKHLVKWVKAFPKMKVTIGNHDDLFRRKARSAGLPLEIIRGFGEILGLPKTWVFEYQYQLKGLLIFHGTGTSGEYAHMNSAKKERQSVIQAHCHSVGGVGYLVSRKDRIFGMSVGCGIDRKKLAFAYGRWIQKKPFVGMGIVADGVPVVVPMKL